jgi:hypothetical protein
MGDELVAAGWNGASVPGGGERLDTFVELEPDAVVPPGTADQLRRVEGELAPARVLIRPSAAVFPLIHFAVA